MKMKLSFIAGVTGGTLYGDDITVTEIVTDSRAAACGSLFAAFKGEWVDGFDFIKNIDSVGGVAYLCDRLPQNTNNPAVVVDDVLTAVGKIARAHLLSLDIKKIAVTGSVGKTTTKEFIRACLERAVSVHSAKGNKNNELGLPLTALGATDAHKAIILEMGMRGLGQIEYLCNIAKPDIAVITNIGICHIELLGSRENILKAKLEAVDALGVDGVAVLNGDDDMLKTVRTDKKTLLYGIDNENCDIRACDVVDNSYTLLFEGRRYPVSLNVKGLHNIYNSLAAIAVGITLGIDIPSLIEGAEAFAGDGSRQNIYELCGYTLFDDTYNASPDSMRASMSVLKGLPGRHAVVLGDMLELGDMTKTAHEGLADAVYSCNAQLVILVGGHMRSLYNKLENVEKYICADSKEAAEILKKTAKKGDAVLFKGSNSMRLDIALKCFKEDMGC